MIVGVRFERTDTIYYYQTRENFRLQEKVVVSLKGERKLGRVVLLDAQVERSLVEPGKFYLASATEQDFLQEKKNIEDAKLAKKIGREKVEKHGLEMKLTHVAYVFDRSKLIFYFTADGRIDFRELVKDLAAHFKTRIELRQIGVRDEAKILGGLGPCGRTLCCSNFLGEFAPVSIKMAKDQGLSLNPIKISGLCGRLLCCLDYEQEEYELAKKEVPDWGTYVETPEGLGQVQGVNLLTRTLRIKMKDKEGFTQFLASEVTPVKK